MVVSISRTDTLQSIASEAVIPAACPNAIQQGSIRRVENPMCEPDTGTGSNRLSMFRGRITPNGTVYTAVG